MSDNRNSCLIALPASPSTQFLKWDYFHWDDPTHGSVDYVNLADAQAANLVNTVDGKFKMSVDTGSLVGGLRVSSSTQRVECEADKPDDRATRRNLSGSAHRPTGKRTSWSLRTS